MNKFTITIRLNHDVSPEHIMRLLKETYEPLEITVESVSYTISGKKSKPQWYTPAEIAKECGLSSLYGKPHAQAASCILNENVLLHDGHKRVITGNSDDRSVCTLYDDYALSAVRKWIMENEMPSEIYGSDRTYYVQYLY